LTDSIKADTEAIWLRLLDAYERGAHTALGYDSWADYMQAEFGTSETHAHRLLDAGRVARAIEAHSPMGERPVSERVARELAPVLRAKGEEAVVEAWSEVVKEHGPEPTAEETRAVVNPRGKKLTTEQKRFGNNLSGMALCADYVSAFLQGRTKEDKQATARLLAVDEATMDAWIAWTDTIHLATRKLRRYLKEKP
jgi:hypothetical protein